MHGISMIEVLIAMVILSFGLLSIVALQLVPKKTVLASDPAAQAAVLGRARVPPVYRNNTLHGQNIHRTTARLRHAPLGTVEPAPNAIPPQCRDAPISRPTF